MSTVREKPLDQSTIDALRSIEFDGDDVGILTCGQLDRKVYTKVNEALESLGGKWNRKAKGHVFQGDARDTLEAVIETGRIVSTKDAKQIFGEFFTPQDLAFEVVAKLNAHNDAPSFLEPSAGDGQLIKAVLADTPTACVYAVEIQDKRRKELQAVATGDVVIADFLSLKPDHFGFQFGFVAMNPPFARQDDVRHVLHAWSFLNPGGRLAAIMSSGWTFRENQLSKEFREFVSEFGDWTANDDKSFKASGTGVNSVTVVLDKPE